MKLLASLCVMALSSLTPQIASAQNKDIVIVGGAITEIVYALGAQDRIAATDTTSLFPAAAQNTPKVGYQRSLSAEGVLAFKPKFIFAAGEAGPATAVAQIQAAGVRFEKISPEHSAAALLENINKVATWLEMPAAGKKLSGQLEAEWAQTKGHVERLVKTSSNNRKPKVLFLLAHGGPSPQVAGEGTSANAMILLAGGENAMNGFNGYRPLTTEGSISAQPDIILITTQGLSAQGSVDALLKNGGLALTPAGKAKRVVNMEALALLGFGPRLPQVVADLATQFYR